MWIPITIALIAGFAIGVSVAFYLKRMQTRTARELADELFKESEELRKIQLDAMMDNVKASFGSLSRDALAKSNDEFLKLAKVRLGSEREVSAKELESKKTLIDQQLERMGKELTKVSTLVNDLEKDREQKFGELTSTLKNASRQTAELMHTTNTLKKALASSQTRGQWGERMAEDVLKMAGLIEKVNYLKQKTIGGSGSRPDFTFLLPRDLKLNMDVKFPLDNYIKYQEATSDLEKNKYKSDFLKDVKARIKEVTTRDYINPEQNTVDYVLLFIPNEQIYAFIHEQDSSILDQGLKNKVIFCSPITLFAVLAVIRQAVQNFALEQTSNKIFSHLRQFRKQWTEYCDKFQALGKRIDSLHNLYTTLDTTRRRQLEKPLTKIESLISQQELPAVVENNLLPSPVEKNGETLPETGEENYEEENHVE